jgi:very-short-patch-repair endonuclease
MPVWRRDHAEQDHARANRADPTPAEIILWRKLRRSQLGFRFRRQEALAGYIVDFLCHSQRLVIETDGESHTDSKRDARRDQNLARLGYRVIRVWDEDVKHNLEGVLVMITDALHDGSGEGAERSEAEEAG